MKINNTAVLALLSVCTLVMTSCSDDKKQESAPAAKPEAQAEAKPEAEVKEANPAKELAEEMIVVLNDMADVIENLTVENAQEQIAKLKDIKAKADAMEAKVAALTPEQMKEVEDDETVKAAVEKAQTRIENAMAKMQEEGNEALALIMIAAMAGEEMPDMEEETPELPEVEPVVVDVEDEEPAAVEEEAADVDVDVVDEEPAAEEEATDVDVDVVDEEPAAAEEEATDVDVDVVDEEPAAEEEATDVDVDVVDEEPAAEEEAAEMEEDLELVDDTEEDVEDEEEAADAEEELELDEEPAEDEELDLEL